ncbi:hypothetical protein ACT3TZ_14650 [Brachybacterium sp. AOP25-B2-12]|uniref:hypothetical protein n=1 Tax=Brachybacterium sp. AOP25-B2-12 TaxID=3457710 RepID=UPI004033389E
MTESPDEATQTPGRVVRKQRPRDPGFDDLCTRVREATEQVERVDRERQDRIRERDQLVAEIYGWGVSYETAGELAGLSKSAAAIAARTYPESVVTGRREWRKATETLREQAE